MELLKIVWPRSGSLSTLPYLTIQAKKDDHNKEQSGPQRGKGHFGQRFGISDEGQTRSRLCYILNRNAAYLGHIAQGHEDDKTSQEASKTIHHRE